MSTWYEVTVTQIITVAVEIDDSFDENDAMTFALDECSMDGDRTATCVLIPEDRIDALKRHADLISSMEDQ